jgi:hypothetical protein
MKRPSILQKKMTIREIDTEKLNRQVIKEASESAVLKKIVSLTPTFATDTRAPRYKYIKFKE